jgi:cytidylate kinase
MEKQHYSIAIDGPGGAGKSTIARRAAAELGFVYVDTGAIYRAVACAALSRGIDPSDEAAVSALLPSLQLELRWTEDGVQHVWLNGADISAQLRTPEVSTAASRVSALPVVRQFLLEQQRVVARTHDVIMDGRDIGTVVLPDAAVETAGVRSSEEISAPFSQTCCTPSSVQRSSSCSDGSRAETAASSDGSMPRERAAQATAR